MRILGTGDKTFDEALRTLAGGIRGLAGTTDRRLARRNARQRVLKALRKIRTALDEQAPAIIERGEVKRVDGPTRLKRLERAGWKTTASPGLYAAAGVPVKRVAWKITEIVVGQRHYVNGKGWVQDDKKHVSMHEYLLVPAWAKAIGSENPTKLRAAKKDQVMRKAIVATELLQESAR